MEESPYVPNSLPPALVVFGGSSYNDIRMQRPFSSQVSDGKELNLSNLSASSFGLRPMESYGGLPASLVHLQNPFLHPALDARLGTPFGSAGAFRPVVTSSSSSSVSGTVSNVGSGDMDGNSGRPPGKSLPSAFTPPNNNRRTKSIMESSMENERERDRDRDRDRDRNSGFPPSSSSSASGGSVSSQSQQQQSNLNSSSSSSSSGVLNLDKSYINLNASVNGGRHRSISPSNNNNIGSKEERDRDRDRERERERERDDYNNERDENATPNSDVTDRSTPDDAHLPSKRRRAGQGGGGQGDLLCCPVCKISLRPMELESHLLSEVEQLMVMSRIRRPGRLDEPSTSSNQSESSPSGLNHNQNQNKKDSTPAEVSQDSRWETYHRVRGNRHSRLRLKTRRRREESGGGPHLTCPVCHVLFPGSHDQLSAHVEMCLRKNGDMLDEDEPVDIEGDGDIGHEMEDYEWLAHRRGPHHPNISPNYSVTALNMTTNSRRRVEENDSLEVVVDGDDTYGQSQYTESDIQSTLQAASSQNQNRSSSPPDSHHDTKVRGWDDEESNGGGDENAGANSHLNQTMLLKALKVRIRELEKELKCGGGAPPHDGNSCLICMDKYRKPVVSISCWHVHCEECWLKTLGAKKLCPQCNMITSASDLRRIFL